MHPTDTPSRSEGDPEPLLSIGAFARRVGLAPSALRFYDDCGLLRPAHVDAVTGYRSYRPDQERRALLVRRLRAAGLPLVDAVSVLDGPPEQAERILRDHLRTTRAAAAAARTAVEDLLGTLPAAGGRASARLGGLELAAAVRQVAPAAAEGPGREAFPVLGRVLLELEGDEVRLVATDRYRLAVRVLRAEDADDWAGRRRHALVDVPDLRRAASWALRWPEVTVVLDGYGLRLCAGDETRTVAPYTEEEFPAYRLVLDELPAPRHRVIVDRAGLCGALGAAGAAGAGPVLLRAEGDGLVVTGDGADGVTLRAVCTGPPLRVAFDPAVFLAALDAGVGPDALLEIASPTGPVVVRSADQGSFTTLVMPVRDATATPDRRG
ncbi:MULTISPECIES: DNA polymerase III subunit beta family protein [Streptomyces]|uniref:DNA polymerase III subunit beta family protein n=1 Tax=Streptomyces TaxID=1883 RepID=UPI00163BC1A8|nr:MULTISPECIES: MerR family transcriptional regulator [Streptomyces]MBC2873732.1 MerR family transcriptional regulator [Streptomyces sp. TYQ1024]UBI37841.1 MerR family transcriptional regulator [Streptomyces mobaraensis]UKW30429.1 MerR family transcriptional regulator [Streptomyces sp. TYQ1024]